MKNGQIGIIVANAPPKAEISRGGEKHLAVDPVFVLLFQTLLRSPSPFRTFVSQTCEFVPLIGLTRNRESENVHGPVLNDDAVAAVGKLDQARCAVTIFGRNTVRPALRRYF